MNRIDNTKRKKRYIRVILISFLIVLAIVVYIGFDVFLRTRSLLVRINQEVDTVDLRREQDLPELELGETPFSVLILGIDSDWEGDPGRADTIMVATVNPNLGTTYLLSIARDTMVDISGWGTTRINHAHAYGGGGHGGVELTINTIQNFLNIPIDYYATLQMHGLADLIDAFGGVTVYNDTVDFSLGGHQFPLGYNYLTGDAASYYTRMRLQDPRGDFGRQERQRDVIAAMADDLVGVATVTKYQRIIDAVGNHMITDVSLAEMVQISTGYARALRNITNLQLNYSGQIISGMYLIPIPEHSRIEMSNRLRDHLELD